MYRAGLHPGTEGEAEEEYEAFGDGEAIDEFAEWQELAGSADLDEPEILDAQDIREADSAEGDSAAYSKARRRPLGG